MKKVRFGIIGIGNQGNYYAKLLKEGKIENGELVAICDWDEPSLHNHDDKNVALYTDFDEFLKDSTEVFAF